MLLKTQILFSLVVFCFAAPLFAQQPAEKSGIVQRTPWTASNVVGTPDPPSPYKVERVFEKLTFARPLLITNAPGSERWFVAEQAGKVFSFPNDPNCEAADLAIDLKQARPELRAIYGLAFHPDFANNRFVYICYVRGGSNPDGTHVARFKMTPGEPPRIDPDSEQTIITWRAGGHNGGCLKFGPDGFLYITTGDAGAASPPDELRAGQDVTNLLSAVLRIDVDGGEENTPYRTPPDNPLVNIAGARPEIWAYGFRNPWKISFDRQSGDLWLGDVGWELWEMIYQVEKGGNYGWSIVEGRQSVLPEQKPGPTPILPPTLDHPHSEAGSITGGFVYRGQRLKQIYGAYIYGDYQSGIVWGARRQDGKISWRGELARTPLQLVGFGEDHHGELTLLDYQGGIFRLVENDVKPSSKPFPRKLSQTGLFADAASQAPAPGVIPYSINARHWADHARSQRWLAVPGEAQIEIDNKGNWQFPDGSVIAKTVSLDDVEVGATGDAYQTVRLETQILHREAGSWRPYTYVWNDEQTDAELADAEGFSRQIIARDPLAPGGVREQTYRFASRQQCALCHNPWVEARTTIFGVQSASLLGMHVNQLNRHHSYENGSANQLATFEHIGLLKSPPKSREETAALVDPYGALADIDARARAYLHVNCAHCHQFNAGGAATIGLAHDVALKDAKMIDVRPTQGTFNLSGARIIAPGDPHGSVLFYRAAKLGGGRMPRVGSSEVDVRGVKLLHDWIAQLDGGDAKAQQPQFAAPLQKLESESAEVRGDAIEKLTASTRGALALLQTMQRGDLPNAAREQIVSLTKDHPAAEVRDLFERFVPVSERIKRLGAVVNQSEILSLEADSARGKEVFLNNSAAACKNCHKIGELGQALGPDLDQIGRKYPRDQLLAHILDPSRFMEPKYVPYLLETTGGRIYSGLLEKQTDDQVILKDAQNKLHAFPAGDIELLVRQQKSLMPELLLRDLTRQQVADLLAYLASLK